MCFSFAWTPLQAIYPSEVFAYDVRGKGLATQSLMTAAMGCINTFALPVALERLGYKGESRYKPILHLYFLCRYIWYRTNNQLQSTLSSSAPIYSELWSFGSSSPRPSSSLWKTLTTSSMHHGREREVRSFSERLKLAPGQTENYRE